LACKTRPEHTRIVDEAEDDDDEGEELEADEEDEEEDPEGEDGEGDYEDAPDQPEPGVEQASLVYEGRFRPNFEV
jgi:hypothetical protein